MAHNPLSREEEKPLHGPSRCAEQDGAPIQASRGLAAISAARPVIANAEATDARESATLAWTCRAYPPHYFGATRGSDP